MFSLPELTFNLVLFSLIGGLACVGFFFGEARIRAVAYGAVLAFFVLLAIPDTLIGDTASKINAPLATAKIGFLALLCVLSLVGSIMRHRKSEKKVQALILGIITALFISSQSIVLLTEKARDSLLTEYNLAAMVYGMRFIILLVLAGWLVISQFIPFKWQM